MECVETAIKVLRKTLMSITGLANEYIINGESIRGAELVTIKNGQKVPIGYGETCIVTYVNPTDEMSIIQSEDTSETLQSYELHLIIFGDENKKMASKIKANFYQSYLLDTLREKGIDILRVGSIENGSEFLTSDTYVVRSDVRIAFNVIIENDMALVDNNIEESNNEVKSI